ncbi:MAG: hypothetical protein VXX23_03515 [Actinomycetota bacterium]|nr:hypothetical protein [Actinomycetota bacterium]
MKWFLTGNMFDLDARLRQAGETVVSDESMYIDHDSCEEMDDYKLTKHMSQVEDFDVLVLSQMNRKPFYAKKSALLWVQRAPSGKRRVLIGGNEGDPEAVLNTKKKMPMCSVKINCLEVYITDYFGDRARTYSMSIARTYDAKTDIQNLIDAARDSSLSSPRGRGKVYGQD